MKLRFTLFRRGRSYYSQDRTSGQRSSLHTTAPDETSTILAAKNEAHRQPILNLHLARTYLSVTDPEISRRTWQAVMDEMAKTKRGVTLHRHLSAMKAAAFDLIRALPVPETQAIHFMPVLESGGVATNVFLRRLHNFALGINWLPWPILPKKLWP